MANRKITQFTDLAGAQTPTMVMPVVNPAAGSTDAGNRKSTLNDLFADPTINVTDKGISFTGLATGSAPAVSAAGKCKLYFDTTLNKFMLSRSGAAYQQVITGTPTYPLSFDDVGGQIRLTSTNNALDPYGLWIASQDNLRTAILTVNSLPTSSAVSLQLRVQNSATSSAFPSLALAHVSSVGGSLGDGSRVGGISFYNGPNVGAFIAADSILSGGDGTNFTLGTVRKNALTSATRLFIDDWGVSSFLRTPPSQLAADPSKIVQIGFPNTVNGVTFAALTINGDPTNAGATTWRQLVLQTTSGQSVNTFESRDSSNNLRTCINASGVLIPGTAGGLALGSAALPWSGIYLGNAATNNFLLTGVATAARTITLPDASITVSGSASALTSGRVPFVTTGGLLTDSAQLTYDGTTLNAGTGYLRGTRLGIGIAASSYPIQVAQSATNGSPLWLFLSNFDSSHNANGANYNIAFENSIRVAIATGITNSGYQLAIRGEAFTTTGNGGTLVDLIGIYGGAYINSTSDASTVVTNAYGIRARALNLKSGATLTNAFGVYVEIDTGFGVTNRWDFYGSNATAKNYFAGFVSVGVDANTAQFQVNTGSASRIAAIIRGAASQTANLTEWQNSGGTILSAIDSSGRFYAPAALTATTVGAAGGASAPPATPDGYLLINVNGTQKKVPYYAN